MNDPNTGGGGSTNTGGAQTPDIKKIVTTNFSIVDSIAKKYNTLKNTDGGDLGALDVNTKDGGLGQALCNIDQTLRILIDGTNNKGGLLKINLPKDTVLPDVTVLGGIKAVINKTTPIIESLVTAQKTIVGALAEVNITDITKFNPEIVTGKITSTLSAVSDLSTKNLKDPSEGTANLGKLSGFVKNLNKLFNAINNVFDYNNASSDTEGNTGSKKIDISSLLGDNGNINNALESINTNLVNLFAGEKPSFDGDIINTAVTNANNLKKFIGSIGKVFQECNKFNDSTVYQLSDGVISTVTGHLTNITKGNGSILSIFKDDTLLGNDVNGKTQAVDNAEKLKSFITSIGKVMQSVSTVYMNKDGVNIRRAVEAALTPKLGILSHINAMLDIVNALTSADFGRETKGEAWDEKDKDGNITARHPATYDYKAITNTTNLTKLFAGLKSVFTNITNITLSNDIGGQISKITTAVNGITYKGGVIDKLTGIEFNGTVTVNSQDYPKAIGNAILLKTFIGKLIDAIKQFGNKQDDIKKTNSVNIGAFIKQCMLFFEGDDKSIISIINGFKSEDMLNGATNAPNLKTIIKNLVDIGAKLAELTGKTIDSKIIGLTTRIIIGMLGDNGLITILKDHTRDINKIAGTKDGSPIKNVNTIFKEYGKIYETISSGFDPGSKDKKHLTRSDLELIKPVFGIMSDCIFKLLTSKGLNQIVNSALLTNVNDTTTKIKNFKKVITEFVKLRDYLATIGEVKQEVEVDVDGKKTKTTKVVENFDLKQAHTNIENLFIHLNDLVGTTMQNFAGFTNYLDEIINEDFSKAVGKAFEQKYVLPKVYKWEETNNDDGTVTGEWKEDKKANGQKYNTYQYITEIIKKTFGSVLGILNAVINSKGHDEEALIEARFRVGELFIAFEETFPFIAKQINKLNDIMMKCFAKLPLDKMDETTKRIENTTKIIKNICEIFDELAKDRGIMSVFKAGFVLQKLIGYLNDIQKPLNEFLTFARVLDEKKLEKATKVIEFLKMIIEFGFMMAILPVLLPFIAAGFVVFRGLFALVGWLTKKWKSTEKDQEAVFGKSPDGGIFAIFEHIAKGMMWAVGCLFAVGLALLLAWNTMLIGLVGFVVLLGITFVVLMMLSNDKISKGLNKGEKGIKALMWLYGALGLLVLELYAFGMLMQTSKGILFNGLILLVGVVLLTAGMLWLLSKLKLKDVAYDIAILAIALIAIGLVVIIATMITVMGSIQQADFWLGALVLLEVVGITAALAGIGALLLSSGVGAELAIGGILVITVIMGLMAASMWCVSYITEKLVEIGAYDQSAIGWGLLTLLEIIGATVVLGALAVIALPIALPAMAGLAGMLMVLGPMAEVITAAKDIVTAAIELHSLVETSPNIWDYLANDIKGLINGMNTICFGEDAFKTNENDNVLTKVGKWIGNKVAGAVEGVSRTLSFSAMIPQLLQMRNAMNIFKSTMTSINDAMKVVTEPIQGMDDSEDVVEKFNGISSIFQPISDESLKSWQQWADSVKQLGDNLKNVVEQMKDLVDVLDDNQDTMADFCANVITLIEEETGQKLGAQNVVAQQTTSTKSSSSMPATFGSAGANTQSSKSDTTSKDIKSVLDNIKSTLANIESKFNSGVPIKTMAGSPLTVINK